MARKCAPVVMHYDPSVEPDVKVRGRHAQRWMLGVGLVFVVVVGMALQAAQRRAGERWYKVVTHWNEEVYEHEVLGIMPAFDVAGLPPAMLPNPFTITTMTHGNYFSDTSGGNIFRSWRQSRWEGYTCTLALRQERGFFGSSTEARMTGGESALVDAARDVFSAVDIELVVEP